MQQRYEDYILIVSVADDASNALTKKIIDLMRELGFEFDLKGKFRYGYLAVLDQGKCIEEQCGL